MNEKPTAKTVAMLIVSILTALNAVFAFIGMPILDIDFNAIYTICTTVWTIIIWAIGFWKNQNWTPAAIESQKILDKAKGK